MTRYIHALTPDAQSVHESESTSFHLGVITGGYASLGTPNRSRYQGFAHILPFGNAWELFKSVEDISIEGPVESITLRPGSVERVRRDAIEQFSTRGSAILYSVRAPRTTVRIALDMRAVHDFATDGRHYSIQDVPGGHVITYRCPRYSFCLAILGGTAQYAPSWREVEYAYDKRRGSLAKLWVCDALTYSVTHALELRFGVGWTVQQALDAANSANNPEEQSKLSPIIPANSSPNTQTSSTSDVANAYAGCVRDLEEATIDLPRVGTGVIAGYPWFYQVYTRDEAISVGALIALGDHERAKRVLLRETTTIRHDGRIDNRTPASELASADGVGWAFLRLRQLSGLNLLSDEERRHVMEALRSSLQGLEHHWVRESLVHNGWKETWMDTTGGFEDGRAGARIEVQALSYSMYSFMAELCEGHGDGDAAYYRNRASLLKNAVRALFLDPRSGALADGVADHVDRTARPNIFLAAYAAPELFSYAEWHRIFTVSLERLWLPWGGLATIDREHLLFTPSYTGENDRSYHRGDSWYFVNNIAAIVLGQAGFTRERDELLRASTKQLLEMGIPGHAAETSSAQRQEAHGCFIQTWSAATYVEAVLSVQNPSLTRPGLPAWPSQSSSSEKPLSPHQ